jgi:type IX secretion system substrate protein
MIQGLSAAAKTIALADLNGRIIQQVNVTGTNYSFQIQALPAGMYFISVNDNNKTITLRFIKE